MFPQLFHENANIKEGTLVWLLYQAPTLSGKELVENKNRGKLQTLRTESGQEFKFRPGRYKFPCKLPFNATSFFGISVRRFESNQRKVGDKGYWIWYVARHEAIGKKPVNVTDYYLVE